MSYECIGFIAVWTFLAVLAFNVLRMIYRTFVAPSLGHGHKWKVADNYWAVVTGSTDGIGLEYAKEMANKGYNVLLLSRSEEKLAQTSELIKSKCSKCKEVRTLAVDFTKLDIYDQIKKELEKLDHIEVLVNNVGISYVHVEYFHRIENRTELLQNLINVNVAAVTRLTDLVLPRMIAQKSGVVINVSSLSAVCPSPLLTVYAATKTYVDNFSRGLSMEYDGKGVIVQSVLPGLVASKMSKVRPSLMAPAPSTYVKAALSMVGIESRTFGYWPHKIQGAVVEAAGRWLGVDLPPKLIYNSLQSMRKKYYKKYNLKED